MGNKNRTKAPKKTVWYKHKNVRRSNKQPHEHPSHPYSHPRGRMHLFPPSSRIKDRKGKHFRNTPQERQRTHVKSSYRSRGGRRKRWD